MLLELLNPLGCFILSGNWWALYTNFLVLIEDAAYAAESAVAVAVFEVTAVLVLAAHGAGTVVEKQVVEVVALIVTVAAAATVLQNSHVGSSLLITASGLKLGLLMTLAHFQLNL